MSPYITVEEAAKRTGLTTGDLATIRWNDRRDDDHGLRWVFITGGTKAAPLYDEASVDAWVARRDVEADEAAEAVA